MDKLSKDITAEADVQTPPPPYNILFGEPSTSNNFQYQSQSIASTGNVVCPESCVIEQPTPDESMRSIKSHLTWSILNILFCCWCFGLAACCSSMETKKLRKQGDIKGALKASERARKWNTLATIFGIIIIGIAGSRFFFFS